MNSSVTIAPITESLPQFLTDKSYSKIFVITDTNTRKHCYPLLKPLLPTHSVITIKPGEEYKNLTTCSSIWEQMTKANADRHALVIDLGGGVIGDMGGFCASTYKRGVDFIQIPTTLLSQVDASVGGKLGIDFQGLKNHLGVFTLPKTVLIDPIFLQTLPEREIRSGFAEIIKHCLIADKQMWQTISKQPLAAQPLAALIAHSVTIKDFVVTEDPTEKGLRKILNFGHTLGHAVETYFLEKGPKEKLLHGEAIAIGMIMESFLAHSKGLLSASELEEITQYFLQIYGKVLIPDAAIKPIILLTRQDKKNKGKEINFSLIEGIGQCQYNIKITDKEMLKAINFYRNTSVSKA